MPEELTSSVTYQLRKPQDERDRFNPEIPTRPPQGPSEWFGRKFPASAQTYGCPFLEAKIRKPTGFDTLIATDINEAFFASALGGRRDLGHEVVYYEPEAQFYYKEPHDGLFRTTSEEKLMALLACYLSRCAEEMPGPVDKFNLFVKFREEEQLRAIVRKARSILEAHESFFSLDSPNERIAGPETQGKTAKLFILSALESSAQKKITVTQAFEAFRAFCTREGLMLVARKHFKSMVAEIIKAEFGVGLRHDVDYPGGKQTSGWVGLGLRTLELAGN